MAENNRVIGNRPLKINITIYELITLASILIEFIRPIGLINKKEEFEKEKKE